MKRLGQLEEENSKLKKLVADLIQARIPNPDAPTKKNECWAMEFASDPQYNGKKFQASSKNERASQGTAGMSHKTTAQKGICGG